MARDSSGTYALPAGTAVTSGAVIESAWANALTADLEGEMTNSLDRAGRGGMTGVLKLPDGSVSAPALTFSSNSNLGWYRAGTGDMRLAVGGSDVLKATSAGVAATVTGDLTATGDLTVGGALATGTALTRSSLPAVGQQVSSACGSFTTISATPVDVTNLTVTITTTGRPVLLMVEAGTTGGSIYCSLVRGGPHLLPRSRLYDDCQDRVPVRNRHLPVPASVPGCRCRRDLHLQGPSVGRRLHDSTPPTSSSSHSSFRPCPGNRFQCPSGRRGWSRW